MDTEVGDVRPERRDILVDVDGTMLAQEVKVRGGKDGQMQGSDEALIVPRSSEEINTLDVDVMGSLNVLDAIEHGDSLDDLGIEPGVPQIPQGEGYVSASLPRVEDGHLETMQGEMQQLRYRLGELETLLESKEMEFNERLLEESTRARQALGERQKVANLEREIKKLRDAVEHKDVGREKKERVISELRESLRSKAEMCKQLEARVEYLTKELGSSEAKFNAAHEQINTLLARQEKLQIEVANQVKQRKQAREILSATVQGLEELRCSTNFAD